MGDKDANKTLKLGEIAVFIPLFHFLITSLFLVGYYSQIGSGISMYASPSDMYPTAIGDVGPLLISVLVLSAVILASMRAQKGAWTSAEAVQLAPQGEQRDRARARHEKHRKAVRKILLAVTLLDLMFLIFSYYSIGFVFYSEVGHFFIIGTVVFLVWFANKTGIDFFKVISAFLIITLMIISGFMGLSQAQLDLHTPYNKLISRNPRCGNYAVYRKVGEGFFSLSTSNKRFIISKECKAEFELPS